MYDTIDVHGGSVGVPVWMTERRWRSLRVIERAILPVEVLRALRELLLSQKSCLNAEKPVHGEQRNLVVQVTTSSCTESFSNIRRRVVREGVDGSLVLHPLLIR
jgi:hypothetical protein